MCSYDWCCCFFFLGGGGSERNIEKEGTGYLLDDEGGEKV